MKKRFLQYLFLSCSLMVLFSACRKDSFSGKETLQSGKSYVWITEAPENNQFFDIFTDVKTVTMFTIRRDAANNADNQKAITVTLKTLDQAYLDGLGTGYTTIFPTNIYTMPSDADLASGGLFTGSEGITKTADGLTINFAAGEFAKNVIFKIDGSKVDLSKKYAAGFAITNFGGFSKKVGRDTILATVGIKNEWDGDYAATGTIAFPPGTGGTDRAWTDRDKPLVTVNANTVVTEAGDLGGNGFYMNLTINPDNTVTITPAQAAPATLGNNGVNVYDPATKTFTLNYKYVGGTGDRVIHDVLVRQ